MVDKEFLDFIENAIKEYREYQSMQNKEKFTFQEFLSIIQIWKMEEILERLEETKP